MQTLTVRRLRWSAPFVAAAAVAAAAVLPGVASGSDHPTLPTRTAAQLLADVATLEPPTLSGTIVETARLGLPELPSTGRSAADLTLTNLLTGSHTARIWLAGPDRQRVALVGDLSESDIVHSGKDVWIYSSQENLATHMNVPVSLPSDAKKALTSGSVPTPAEVAARVLAAVTPTTRVSVDATARVAGQPAYQLVISPKNAHSLITKVTIALDSQTKVPLRVQVYGRDTATPAFETGFTDISFATPPASVFHFIPPTGARISQSTPGQLLPGTGEMGGRVVKRAGEPPASGPAPGSADPSTDRVGTRTIGSGWTAVVETDGSALTGGASGPEGSSPILSVLLRSATTVPQGKLITTALLSALITKDGHLYVGAVDGATLQRVAATGQPA